MAGGGGKSSRCRLSYNFSDKKHLRFLVLCNNLSTLLKTRRETDEDGKFRGKEGNLYIEFRGNFCKLRDTLNFANRSFPSRKNRVKLLFLLRAAYSFILDDRFQKFSHDQTGLNFHYKNRMIVLRKYSPLYVMINE